jgi:hypothetical protein
MKTVEVVTRKGCHLCDIALGELDLLKETIPFLVKLTYLEDHPEKTGEFGNDIPVILVEGKVVCRHNVNRGALIGRLTSDEPKAPR